MATEEPLSGFWKRGSMEKKDEPTREGDTPQDDGTSQTAATEQRAKVKRLISHAVVAREAKRLGPIKLDMEFDDALRMLLAAPPAHKRRRKK